MPAMLQKIMEASGRCSISLCFNHHRPRMMLRLGKGPGERHNIGPALETFLTAMGYFLVEALSTHRTSLGKRESSVTLLRRIFNQANQLLHEVNYPLLLHGGFGEIVASGLDVSYLLPCASSSSSGTSSCAVFGELRLRSFSKRGSSLPSHNRAYIPPCKTSSL